MRRQNNLSTPPLAALAKSILLVIAALSLSGCEVIGDIFQAGFWTGVVIVAVVAAIAIFVVRMMR